MSQAPVTVLGFETSNNMKVRVALGYKRIPYVFREIDPAEREEVVRISGQHLTPVLVHGTTVLFDSGAILRYLDANFPGTPKLFGASRDEQWAIEDHEFFARTRLSGPMLEVVHTMISTGGVEDETRARCTRAFAAAVEELASALDGREWLVGDGLTAADVTAAPVLLRVERAGIFEMPAAAGELEAWRDRVMAFDGPARVT